MAIKKPSRSLFRPLKGVDQGFLHENRAHRKGRPSRHSRGTLSLGALTLLGGCDVSENDKLQTVLRGVSAWNDGAPVLLFRPGHRARHIRKRKSSSHPASTRTMTSRTLRRSTARPGNSNCPVSSATSGHGRCRRSTSCRTGADHPAYLRGRGWDYIGQWSGVNLRGFLERIAVTAKYIACWRRRLHRKSRHGDGASSPDHAGDEIRARADHRSVRFPLRLRTSTARLPRIRNGSRRWKSRTIFPRRIIRRKASTGSRAFERRWLWYGRFQPVVGLSRASIEPQPVAIVRSTLENFAIDTMKGRRGLQSRH